MVLGKLDMRGKEEDLGKGPGNWKREATDREVLQGTCSADQEEEEEGEAQKKVTFGNK